MLAFCVFLNPFAYDAPLCVCVPVYFAFVSLLCLQYCCVFVFLRFCVFVCVCFCCISALVCLCSLCALGCLIVPGVFDFLCVRLFLVFSSL